MIIFQVTIWCNEGQAATKDRWTEMIKKFNKEIHRCNTMYWNVGVSVEIFQPFPTNLQFQNSSFIIQNLYSRHIWNQCWTVGIITWHIWVPALLAWSSVWNGLIGIDRKLECSGHKDKNNKNTWIFFLAICICVELTTLVFEKLWIIHTYFFTRHC